MGKETARSYVARLRQQARSGDVASQATLGWCCQTGFGMEGKKPDFPTAVYWFRKAAESGHAAAQCSLGEALDSGIGVPPDPVEAVRWYRKAADQKFATAEYDLGLSYARGAGVPQSWAEAARWYRRAAAKGEPHAQTNLGNIYLLGRGVPVDLVEARSLLEKPAASGVAEAQFSLALVSLKEFRIPEAAGWYERAAHSGFPAGAYFWSECLMKGQGVPKDQAAALKWLERSAKAGFAPARGTYARVLLSGEGGAADVAGAVKWARLAVEKGEPVGQHVLGVCCHRGSGVPRDVAEAARLYRLAAEQGVWESALNLAMLLEAGKDVPRDYSESAKWYRLAAEQGNYMAQYRLGLQYRDGLGVDIDLQQCANWLRKSLAQVEDRETRLILTEVERQIASESSINAAANFGKGVAAAKRAMERNDPAIWDEAIRFLKLAADADYGPAEALLAGCYAAGQGVLRDDDAAAAWRRKAALHEDPDTLSALGMSYVRGRELDPQNAKLAVDLFRSAAAYGNVRAENSFGYALMTGAGVAQDLTAAWKWLTLAARTGDRDAKINLDSLRPRLTPEQIAAAEKMADEFQPLRFRVTGGVRRE